MLVFFFMFCKAEKYRDPFPVQYQNTLHYGLIPSRHGTVRTEVNMKLPKTDKKSIF